MTELICGVTGLGGNALLHVLSVSGADIRDEVTAWATLIGSLAITATTIAIQIYHLIRDRDNDKKGKR